MADDIGIIELNDCELKFSYHGTCWRSSGFATLNGESVIFGEQARKQARLQPLVSFSQHWNQLSLTPIQHGTDKFRHYADFAYHQLLQLHAKAPQCKEVILAIPASFTREQLSLLLGICQSCPFKVIGMVDSAVAAVADKVATGRYLHLDMQLHQCLLTEITVDSKIHISNADIIAGTGLISLYQHWAKYLCAQFIQQCRFDPMHDAASEQALYDLLPQFLSSSANGIEGEEVELTLAGKQVKLNRQSLARHTESMFNPLTKAVKAFGQHDCIFVSNHIVTVPEIFKQLDNTYTLNDRAIEQNSLRHQSEIVGNKQQVSFVSSLTASNLNKNSISKHINKRSTHLLWQSSAYPIGTKPIYISTLGELKLSTQANADAQYLLQPNSDSLQLKLLNGSGAKVNGKIGQNGDLLRLGDELALGAGQQTLTLINVVKDENW